MYGQRKREKGRKREGEQGSKGRERKSDIEESKKKRKVKRRRERRIRRGEGREMAGNGRENVNACELLPFLYRYVHMQVSIVFEMLITTRSIPKQSAA